MIMHIIARMIGLHAENKIITFTMYLDTSPYTCFSCPRFQVGDSFGGIE